MGRATGCVEHERDAVYADYVLTESGGFQMPTPDGAAPAGDRRREGHVLVEDHGARHARPRVAAVPHRQRARHRGRGRAPHRRVPAADPDPRRRGAGSSRACGYPTRDHATRSSTPTASRDALAELPLGHGAARARVHAHHVRADGRARRHEDERDPRPGRARGRHPHAARARPATSAIAHAARRARRPRRRRSRSSRTTTPSTASPIDTPLWDSLARVTAALVRGLGARAVPHGRAAPTTASSGAPASVGYGFGLFRQRLRVRGLRHDVPRQRRARRPGVARRCRRSSGKPSPTTCSTADGRCHRSGGNVVFLEKQRGRSRHARHLHHSVEAATATGAFDRFVDQRTVLLTTYRRDGTPVPTPVHIAVDGGVAYIRTFDPVGQAQAACGAAPTSRSPRARSAVASPARRCGPRPGS